METNLNALVQLIHSQSGLWDNTPNKKDRHRVAMMAVILELAEAVEGHRQNVISSRYYHAKIANAVMRLLDMAGAFEMILDEAEILKCVGEGPTRAEFPSYVYDMVQVIVHDDPEQGIEFGLIYGLSIALIFEIDIFTIIHEKLAYRGGLKA